MIANFRARVASLRATAGEIVRLGKQVGRYRTGPMEATFLAYRQKEVDKRCESLSGDGSALSQTAGIRGALPPLLGKLNVRSLLDAPCGDLNWISELRLGLDRYVGIDIVGSLIEANRARYGTVGREFLVGDISKTDLPKVDLILCRDCLVHLSYSAIFRVVRNFKRSRSTYLLTTTFPTRALNHDIVTGSWRTLNLTVSPFNFPEAVELVNEANTEACGIYSDKSLGLWRLEDIPASLYGC